MLQWESVHFLVLYMYTVPGGGSMKKKRRRMKTRKRKRMRMKKNAAATTRMERRKSHPFALIHVGIYCGCSTKPSWGDHWKDISSLVRLDRLQQCRALRTCWDPCESHPGSIHSLTNSTIACSTHNCRPLSVGSVTVVADRARTSAPTSSTQGSWHSRPMFSVPGGPTGRWQPCGKSWHGTNQTDHTFMIHFVILFELVLVMVTIAIIIQS